MLEILGELLMSVVWWLVLLPVLFILGTPFILIAALFRNGAFGQSVINMYYGIFYEWRKGWFFTP